MIGADVAVCYIDGHYANAVDYNISDKFPVSQSTFVVAAARNGSRLFVGQNYRKVYICMVSGYQINKIAQLFC